MKNATKSTKSHSSSAQATKTARTPSHHREKKSAPPQVDSELRYRMISEAAYLIAERHGFDSNRSLDDWLEAEAQIDQLLSGTTTH